MPFEGLTIELVAVVRDESGTWRPSVPLLLTPQQLRLAGEPATLVVRQEAVATTASGLPAAPTPQSRLDDLLGWRPGGMLTTLALVLAAGGGVVVLRRRQDEGDAGRVRRRLGRLLLEVRLLDLTGVRVVEVASPDALARLAERYGLLVLHWTYPTGAVFVVHDDAIAYRWTAGTEGYLPSGRDDSELQESVAVEPEPEVQPRATEVEPAVSETASDLPVEQCRQEEAEQALRQFEAVEREHEAGLRRVTVDVPAPRSGERQDRQPDGQDRPSDRRDGQAAVVLEDGPPREAEGRPRSEPSFWQGG